MKGSTGGVLTFSAVKGQSQLGATVSAAGFSLNISSDVCRGGSAGSPWGFRDMGTQWTVRNLDLTPYGGATIYYTVGDDTAVSKEYEFRVPPAPGASSTLTMILCKPPPPRAKRTPVWYFLSSCVPWVAALPWVVAACRRAVTPARRRRGPGWGTRRPTSPSTAATTTTASTPTA